MEYSAAQPESVSVVTASGSLDALSAPGLTDFLTQQIQAQNTSLVADLTALEYTSSAGLRVWATFRRALADPTEIKCYLSNAPTHCPPAELVRVTGLRWPIETALEEGKGEVGQDHYETRSWLGWHHHTRSVQSFQAHQFLMRLRLAFKKSPALTTAQGRQLIASAIAQHSAHLLDLGALIHYRQQRNHAAYRSHRQRTLFRHKRRRPKR